MNYYDRQVLLWGEQTQISLSQKSVIIIGCGGLGNSIALALSGLGIHTMHLIDFDIIEIHNIHRQVCFDINDENQYKSDTLAQKLSLRNNQTNFIPHNISFQEFSKIKGLKYDLIIDATDSIIVRDSINHFSKKTNIPWIYSSVEEFNAQVCFFEKSSFDSFHIKQNKPKGIAAPMVMQIASMSANFATRYLCNLEVEKDVLNYMYYKSNGHLEIKYYHIPKI